LVAALVHFQDCHDTRYSVILVSTIQQTSLQQPHQQMVEKESSLHPSYSQYFPLHHISKYIGVGLTNKWQSKEKITAAGH
jgi:hypothetical protein